MVEERQPGARRPSKKLMVLSGAAIFAVYIAGYARTQAAADKWQLGVAGQPGATAAADAASSASGAAASSAATTPAAPATAAAPQPAFRYGDDGQGRDGRDGERERRYGQPAAPATQQTQPAQPAQAAATTPSQPAAAGSGAANTQAPAASAYKNGVFSGTGWSRHGSVSVAVTMKGGKMTSIVVTGCTTHYPCGDVAPMPGEVLQAQSLQVDIVSGATDSSMAFLGAVQQALTQAKG